MPALNRVDTQVDTRDHQSTSSQLGSNVVSMKSLLKQPLQFSDSEVTSADVQQLLRLTRSGKLAQVMGLIQVFGESAMLRLCKNQLDTSVEPSVPSGMQVDYHSQELGVIDCNCINATLYTNPAQQNHLELINGNALEQELRGFQLLNATILDHLLKNTHLIPEEWKKYAVTFWGTIYRRKGDFSHARHVRCLVWRDSHWQSEFRSLSGYWRQDRPAAIIA